MDMGTGPSTAAHLPRPRPLRSPDTTVVGTSTATAMRETCLAKLLDFTSSLPTPMAATVVALLEPPMLQGDTNWGALLLLCPLCTQQESEAPLGTGHGGFIDGWSRLGPSISHPEGMTGGAQSTRASEAELNEVAEPALALLVDEVLALAEGGLLVGGHGDGLALAHQHLLPIQQHLLILRGVWARRPHTASTPSPKPSTPCPPPAPHAPFSPGSVRPQARTLS